MWSGFDVISLLVLAFEFSDSFFICELTMYIKLLFISVYIHINLFEDFFLDTCTCIIIAIFFIYLHCTYKSPCSVCPNHS